jgi:hypothetical protein
MHIGLEPQYRKPHKLSACQGGWDRNRTGALRLWRKWRRVSLRLIPSRRLREA